MKKIVFILLVSVTLAGGIASAQGHRVGGGAYYRPHTTVVIGGGLYSPYYSPFGYFGYPYYAAPGVAARPSKLDQEIEDINHDYAQRIESARMDTGLTGKEKRHQVRELKEARDREIDLAKRDYYKQ